MSIEQWKIWFVFTFFGLPLLTLVISLGVYIKRTWNLRKREIQSTFTNEALKCYFKTFYIRDTRYLSSNGSIDIENPKDVEKMELEFNSLYSYLFGRYQFILSSLLLLLIVIALSVVVAVGLNLNLPKIQLDIFLVGIAGYGGGYMWVLFYLAQRMQKRQLAPSDLYHGCYRLIFSVPIALFLASMFKNPIQCAVAFMLGAFPISTLMTFMRRTVASKLNMQGSFDEYAKELTQIQGIERDQAEMFSQEGVDTILQLAYSDPVDLTIRTGFSFSYVVDCCSQALAWLTFKDDLSKMRRYGVRGAQEVCTMVYEIEDLIYPKNKEEYANQRKEEKEWAEKTLDILSEELGMNQMALRRSFDEIAYDPYTQFLYNVWQADWN
jgi:hypothetical protein